MADVGIRVLSPEETDKLLTDRGGAKCGNCRFYEVGECRRRSPDRGQSFSWGLWPHVAHTSWCGEYEYQPSKPDTYWQDHYEQKRKEILDRARSASAIRPNIDKPDLP
jgi:hypothetical protein